MSEFKELGKELKKYLDDATVDEVRSAFLFAKKMHATQTRHSGEPYIIHPVAVAKTLAEMRLDSKTIIAALLHDVLEDTEADEQQMKDLFGKEVFELVDGVTKLTRINFETKAEAQAESFRKMMLAMTKDIRVILIKLADRLHNMQTLGHLNPTKKRRIARETLDIYAPIANRIGMYNFMVEFEDLGFAAMYPHRYTALKQAVKKTHGNRKNVISAIEKSLKAGFKKTKLNYIRLFGREKHLYSIYRKMRDKGLRFSEVMDIYACRIIVEDIDSCYRVLGLVHGLYKPVAERFKDFIAIPKANGYQCLHTTLFGPYGVPLEVQIRTVEMDQVAEKGIAAHWLYKAKSKSKRKNKNMDSSQIQTREWIENVLHIQSSTTSSLDFIESVKFDLFPDEIYVFTPKGDIIKLPRDSTPIDFAYSIHTEVGNNCAIAKIDRRLASLSTPLQNGQTIEVITVPGSQPDPSWLDFVVTGKARSAIRHFLKSRKREESIKLGHHLLAGALDNSAIDINQLDDVKFAPLLKQMNVDTADDLLEQIGLGNQMPQLVAHQLEIGEPALSADGSPIKNIKPFAIKGTTGMILSFAKCCYPIPGDLIEGVLTGGKGITVHRENCSKLIALYRQPEKCIPLRWEIENETDRFEVKLEIKALNKRGVLAEIASAITEQQSDIIDITIKQEKGDSGISDVIISVHGRAHLADVIRHLKKLNTVMRVTRYKE
ncbi:MAG: bifunctional (p)ppGpp synthetase/guanosine-3',5'-bis(diphosphate) 3'-pyrophosphohydrolase [Pseudomonadota bacterium]